MFHFLFLLISFVLSAQETLQSSVYAAHDPYRWLEDSADPRTQEWLNAQQKRFEQYSQSNPYREKMKQSLTDLLNYEAYSVPIRCGDLYFFKMRLPGENQPVLYVQEGIQGTARVLIDPNQMSLTTPISLADFVPSTDGKLLAYGLAESGSDFTVWRVLDVSSGTIHRDRLDRIKFFSPVWAPDGQSLFYTCLDGDDFYRIYQHTLGRPQEADPLIYENLASPDLFASPSISNDNHYLLINLKKGSSGPNAILYRPLNQPQSSFMTLLPMNDSNYSYLYNDNLKFYCWTNQDAPLGKVIVIDGASSKQQDVIAESKYPLVRVVATGKYFVVGFTDNVISRIALYDRQGMHMRDIALPGMGTVAFAESTSPGMDQEGGIFVSFTNFVQPPAIYHYTIADHKLEVFKRPRLTFNPDDYETRQVFYHGKDGTSIPLFIVYKKGLVLNGDNNTLLYAYGGFGVTVHPSYSTLNMAWLENGGIFALANIRGGAEYGKAWHEAGRRNKKQNCFDDFIAAAEWLIDNQYTHSKKLAIRGASNGGLLTAVCLNQRPDLFGAALVEVGVLDMLRFHLFTTGRFWKVEYGNPEDPLDWNFLSQYSPYHNVKKGVSYPPVLVVTGDHDDRVVPLHSYKYTAAMQEALEENGCVMLRVDRQGGHGAGKSLSQWIEEVADTLSFIKCQLSQST